MSVFNANLENEKISFSHGKTYNSFCEKRKNVCALNPKAKKTYVLQIDLCFQGIIKRLDFLFPVNLNLNPNIRNP